MAVDMSRAILLYGHGEAATMAVVVLRIFIVSSAPLFPESAENNTTRVCVTEIELSIAQCRGRGAKVLSTMNGPNHKWRAPTHSKNEPDVCLQKFHSRAHYK